jgi:hypothetical protein
MAKNHSLRYVPLKFFSNQASKRFGTINDVFKMKKILFHKSYDIKNKLLIIIHADKMSVQKETNVSQTKPRALLFWNSQK